jgi:uncharacterized membrane protein
MLATIEFESIITNIGHSIGLLGVIVIVSGIIYGGVMAARDVAVRKLAGERVYSACRQRMGRGLVLGLEVLVAADIVETVAIQPTFSNIGILAMIVVVRTFLGWSLQLEMEGRWPWQTSKRKEGSAQ